MSRKFQPPEICPVCGEQVPRNAKACPECGADEKSGWREGALDEDGMDLPDDDFDYDKFVEEEIGGASSKSPIQWLWWGAAVMVLIALVLLLLRGVM